MQHCYPLVIQHSYWKWPFIVDLPNENTLIFHSYVGLPEGILTVLGCFGRWWVWNGLDFRLRWLRDWGSFQFIGDSFRKVMNQFSGQPWGVPWFWCLPNIWGWVVVRMGWTCKSFWSICQKDRWVKGLEHYCGLPGRGAPQKTTNCLFTITLNHLKFIKSLNSPYFGWLNH
jgi:hypothetical protein